MKEEVIKLVGDSIKHLGLYISDVYIDKKDFNIELDGDNLDLNNITEASNIINKIIDNNIEVMKNCEVLDIHSKEKGE